MAHPKLHWNLIFANGPFTFDIGKNRPLKRQAKCQIPTAGKVK
jgi:hypothetical protein